MRRILALPLLATALTASALAAQGSKTISPGMTRQQVVTALGKPLKTSEADGYTYIFYANQCTRACGMNDLVTLRGDSVVDAIFRSPDRHYSGTSSSPEMIPARAARRGSKTSRKPLAVKERPTSTGKPVVQTPVAPAKPAPTGTMKPGKPNDVHPSIPANPPKLKPAP